MPQSRLNLPDILASLSEHYGEPHPPPANGLFEHVMWENACYLLPDERRLEVFESLRRQVGLTASAIQNAKESVLLPLAQRGGMRPETRVFRWREIARITLTQFAGNLDGILTQSYADARRALKQFPTIGDPGAEKILLFCGMAPHPVLSLPLESNGLRVLVRLGFGRSQKSYGATYRSVQDAISRQLPTSAHELTQAHLLLRENGKILCKDKSPLCHQCPLAPNCTYAATLAGSFLSPNH